MLVVSNPADLNDKDNFLLIDNNKLIIYLNDYKTKDTYGKKVFEIKDEELKDLIFWRLRNNPKNKYLFGKGKNSPFIVNLLQELGYEGLKGVDTLRAIGVSDCLNNPNGCSLEERLDLMSIMCHSLNTQDYYNHAI
jgi:hypothetical protein